MSDELPDFGFKVYHPTQWDEQGGEYQPADGWVVSLPHQCDAWEIAGEYWSPATTDEAVALLEAFIAQAGDALTALREGRELNAPEEYER